MLRKEKIYLFLKECSKKDKIGEGFSADFIAEKLNLTRNNVSADLNVLYREGRMHKVEGRPTLYLPVDSVNEEKIVNREDVKDRGKRIIHQDSFKNLVGFNGSLASHIKQAQAAILYPPQGLSTLLLGETGTGKTTFAEYMHRFALDNDVIKGQAPYVVFNCADYANNPQLLMAILFGSAEGAYTGSDSDRAGLVEKIDITATVTAVFSYRKI